MTPFRIVRIRTLRRALGAALIAASLAPTYLLLTPGRAGPAGVSTGALAATEYEVLLWGSASILLLAAILTLVVPHRALARAVRFAERLVTFPSERHFTGLLGGLATSLGIAAALHIHDRAPRLLDEMAQLLHARVFASGALAAPVSEPVASRLIQNSTVLPRGWVSIYPPGHTVLLAFGLDAGLEWLVGPLLLGVTAVFSYLATRLLYPRRVALARFAGVLVAISPFLVTLGSGYLSHVSVTAAASATLYLSLRAMTGSPVWMLPAGFVAAYAVTARPWTGLVLGAFLSAGVLAWGWWRDGRPFGWLAGRLGLLAAGGAPLGVALLWYNATLFGSPFRLGYEVTFGAAHGLGLHRDPWGNVYGLREMVSYTATDLMTLGVRLFETPFPVLAAPGLFLVLAPRLSQATRIVAGWALLAVAAAALYWHHGQHFGPRMLFEAAPAFAILVAVALVALAGSGTDPGIALPVGDLPANRRSSFVVWVTVLAFAVGATVILPGRSAAIRWSDAARAATIPPDVEPPAVVFVHGSWAGRVGARLAASGLRRDSIETALRRNDLCAVHLYAEARAVDAATLPTLDLEPLPGTPSTLRPIDIGGATVRIDIDRPPDARCAREANADRLGVVELAPLLWQTALPESEEGAVFHRDLGPETNRVILERTPRTAGVHLFAQPRPDQPPVLMPYEEGMALLWGTSVGAPEGPGATGSTGSG